MPISHTAGSAAAGGFHPVRAAIRNASDRTEVDFDFLMAQARIESGLNPQARASTSSASGLFQFIERTWLDTLHKHGAQHGYGWAAGAIETAGGRPIVRDPAMRAQIMQLRMDPQAASLMAGEFARDNAAQIMQRFGREPDGTELYLAHFLGPAGAARFIAAHQEDPSRAAAPLFGSAAAANRPIFYDKGRMRSLGEIRDLFTAKLTKAEGSASMPIAAAAAAVPATLAGQWQARANAQPSAQPANTNGAATSPGRAPMADVLRSTFGNGEGLGQRASAQVAKAYGAFERFGL